MSRTIPAGILAALTESNVEPFYAIDLLFDDTDGTRHDQAGYAGNRALRFFTGYGTRTIGGETYTGTGTLLSISAVEETSDLSARGTTVTLSSIPADILSLALQEPYQRRKCKIYFGLSNESGVIEVFSGLLNKMSIEDAAESGTISVLVDSKLVELEKASNWRYTSESHKSRYPDDTFFDFVPALQDADIRWGR